MFGEDKIGEIVKAKLVEGAMEVDIVYQNWLRAREYHGRRLRREVENWRNYWALDNELGLGQWPEKVVNYMIEQNRQLMVYNMIMPTVDVIAGGIMAVPYDPEYFPVNYPMTSLTTAMKKAMYSDKEILDWNNPYFQLVRAGLIHEGSIKMYVDSEYDELGNIGFKFCLPGSIMYDPHWKDLESKTCKRCWHDTWHTPEELSYIYPEMKELFAADIKRRKQLGDQVYGHSSGIVPYDAGISHGGGTYQDETRDWGDVHRVIQEYKMVKKEVSIEKTLTENGPIIIPDHIDNNDKVAWLNVNHPTWDPEHTWVDKELVDSCVCTVICPSISQNTALASGEIEIQIGRLPFFPWSACRANGESHSIVDSVRDPQLNINYMQSLLAYKIQIEGGGGAQLADPSKFQDEEEFQDFASNRNDPTRVFRTKAGALDRGGVSAPVVKANFPSEVYQWMNHMIDVMWTRVSKVAPVQKGFGEGAGESGKLYELKKIQSDQQLYTIHYGLKLFWNEVYEAYFMQATNQYALEGIQRQFTYNKGKESITLNEPVELADGAYGIKNDVRMLRQIRHKVIVSEKQETPTQKMENLQSTTKLLQALGQYGPATAQFMVHKAIEYMPGIDEEDREILKEISARETELKMNELETANLKQQSDQISLQMQLFQAQQQLMMMNQQQQTQPAQPGSVSAPSMGGNAAPRNLDQLPPEEAVQMSRGIQEQSVIPQQPITTEGA